nr:transposase [Marinitoga lauensis]
MKNILLEPTGVYSIPLIEKLYKEFNVYVVPTYLIAKFKGNRFQKNDSIDAKILETYYYTQEKQFTKYKVDKKYIIAKKLNLMISERESLLKAKTREFNRLRSELYVIDEKTHDLTKAKLIKYALNTENKLIHLRVNRIKNIEESIELLEEKINKYVDSHKFIKEQIKAIMTIPKFSYYDACIIVSKIVDIKRFKTVKAFKKFLGFGVAKEESGTSIKRTKKIISHKVFKAKMYLFILRNMQKSGDNNIKRAVYYYTYKYNNHYKAVMKVAARIIIRIFYILKYKREYNKSIEYIDRKTLILIKEIIEVENNKLSNKKSRKYIANEKIIKFLGKNMVIYEK